MVKRSSRRLSKPARCSAVFARQAWSSPRTTCCSACHDRPTPRSAKRWQATSAAAPATQRSSPPCTWPRARRAAEKVRVEYQVLSPVTEPEQALSANAPQLHPGGNVTREVKIRHGDQSARADVVVRGEYEIGMQDQAPLGPESGLAIPDGEGGVDLSIATQWLHVDQEQLAGILGLPKEMVRLTLAGIGGAFGAREDLSMQAHACQLALKTGRPVNISYSRTESFVGHVHRHPGRLAYEHGANRDGRLVYVRARIILDGGAYASSSTAVIANATCFSVGPYVCPNATIDGIVVYTNNPPCG